VASAAVVSSATVICQVPAWNTLGNCIVQTPVIFNSQNSSSCRKMR